MTKHDINTLPANHYISTIENNHINKQTYKLNSSDAQIRAYKISMRIAPTAAVCACYHICYQCPESMRMASVVEMTKL